MNMLDKLPDEVILQILSFLDSSDLVELQLTSSRYLILARDNAPWKVQCFDHSQAETLRRRRQWLGLQDARLSELRITISSLSVQDAPVVVGDAAGERRLSDPVARARSVRVRALANWEPGYPDEGLDYYQEYIQRHAPINVGWLGLPTTKVNDKNEFREVTGVGTLAGRDGHGHSHVVTALDDGSVCVWDVSARTTVRVGGRGVLSAQSVPGLLTGKAPSAVFDSHAMMTETGAIECVSVEQSTSKAYFAVKNMLHEVDLNSLQLSSSTRYPFPITALSQSQGRTPVTVGTNMTIHLHDPRDPAFAASSALGRGELIGGSVYSHATLAQPGPLSILHHDGSGADEGSIWVAGRFTSLLNYDRRFFPRLRGTIHSGARIASLSSLPYPWIRRDLDLLRDPEAAMSSLHARSVPGTTIIAAAEYKGKGSLEFYGLPRAHFYQNRQTASASKLLSVAPHGGRVVFSDGDGNLKWVERDGVTYVRTLNINTVADTTGATDTTHTSSGGIWSSSGSEAPGQGDIVQKIVPFHTAAAAHVGSHTTRPDINQDDLLLWTGDGRLGVLGFGPKNRLSDESWHDALEEQALSAEERAREDAERQYGMAMRRALERNADEVRFVRGLGMGFTR